MKKEYEELLTKLAQKDEEIKKLKMHKIDSIKDQKQANKINEDMIKTIREYEQQVNKLMDDNKKLMNDQNNLQKYQQTYMQNKQELVKKIEDLIAENEDLRIKFDQGCQNKEVSRKPSQTLSIDFENQSDKTKDSIPQVSTDEESSKELWEALQYIVNDLIEISKDYSQYFPKDTQKVYKWAKKSCGCYKVFENSKVVSHKSLQFVIIRSKQLLEAMKNANSMLKRKHYNVQEKYNSLLEKYNYSLEVKMNSESQIGSLREKVHQLKAENFKLSSSRWNSPDRDMVITGAERASFISNNKSNITYRDNSPSMELAQFNAMIPNMKINDDKEYTYVRINGHKNSNPFE